MSSAKIDYYKVLEVEKTATSEEIKKSYKKLAIKWHPDKNLENKDEAVQRFREISEAYQVLSNEEKRKKYDLYGSGSAKTYDSTNFKYSDANDIFRAFFSAYGFQSKSDNSFFDRYFKAKGDGSGATYYKYSTSTSSEPYGGTTYYKYTKPQQSQGTGETYYRSYGTNGTYYKFTNPTQSSSNNTYAGYTSGTSSNNTTTGSEELPKQGEKIRTVHHVTREYSNGTKQTIKRTTILSSDGSKQITEEKLDGTNKSTYYVIGGGTKSEQEASKSSNFSGYNFGKRPEPESNKEKSKENNQTYENQSGINPKLYKKVSEPSKVYYADGSEGVYYGSFGSTGNQSSKTKVYYTVRK